MGFLYNEKAGFVVMEGHNRGDEEIVFGPDTLEEAEDFYFSQYSVSERKLVGLALMKQDSNGNLSLDY